jgi:prolyl oligopeptidase
MPKLIAPPPDSPVEMVTDFLHGVLITDPYRWLEDQDSPRTRAWIAEQTRYARSYLDALPGRDQIRERIRQFLAVETYDSLQKVGNRYFFRKRLPDNEQPCIYMRDGTDGADQMLIDPSGREAGKYAAVKPLQVSPDGRLLLYEVKAGGERTGIFELFEIETRKRLPDSLPRGYLRGFAFASDGQGFYYIHEAVDAKRPFYRATYLHVLGTPANEDREFFFAGEDEKIRLTLFSGGKRIVFLVRFLETTVMDIYLGSIDRIARPEPIFREIDYLLALRLVGDRIFAVTDRHAPNRRIVEILLRDDGHHSLIDVVPETDTLIGNCLVTGERIFVSYTRQMRTMIRVFDFSGKALGELPIHGDETSRMIFGTPEGDELLVETESFTKPVGIFRCSAKTNEWALWAQKNIPFDSTSYGYSQVWFVSTDGTRVPMFLVGRHDVLAGTGNPTIMTAYGGYGVSMTPQFSVFVVFLLERGCLFALPNIRGGSEFGVAWHEAAKRRNRQSAFNDFLSAAEWLIDSGRTAQDRLAIFGGSNSGLLVGAALTQRPDLFRAVVCMVPMLDMLRYHLFDNAYVWKDEFGTADDPDDFSALVKYSPYHRVRQGLVYPATMLISGDADRNCNPLHARKMTAQLQAANDSGHPIFLDYSEFRGHSPVLPLTERIEALTDRMAFLCDQLQLSA